MRSRLLPLCLAALLTGAGGLALADDGEMVNKNMTNNLETPAKVVEAYPEVADFVPEAEHAFTDMLLFYVPMQRASGVNGDDLVNVGDDDDQGNSHDPRDYYSIDGVLVETIEVAKPLVNTFIYGPIYEVEHTAFFHSWMDTYAAVSLDDGMTWKKTNLSQTAHLSSFNIETDHVPGGGSDLSELPATHTILKTGGGLTPGWHAPGFDTPYTSGCTECHGALLTGDHHAPSCYSCHGSVWKEANPTAGTVPQIVKAEWKDGDGGTIKGTGEEAPATTTVYIINPLNDKTLGSITSKKDGKFEFEIKKLIQNKIIEKAPCQIAAVANGVEGPAVTPKGTPEDCEGYELPVDIADYPGGTYNVVMASAGNKVLVAWPSRFCEQGQPAYSFAYDANDDDLDTEKKDALIAKREAVAELLGIDVTKDLYLTDLFGVGGSQGSIDFAEEDYPQAGIVPFGCVWTARGVLLPGDDTRTADVVEESHMVWTKAERLTSGRRDPNRIEVHGVPGVGFVMTWQEDPDGLRPGQGEGPGEGWSGAVAHDKTDIWYSFINWEYFDLVEDPADPAGVPVNIADSPLPGGDDEDASGRPQVYVPMAVPMRLSNNDRCVAADYAPGVELADTDPKYFSYCNDAVAVDYGLQDFCAATVDVPLGPQGDPSPICVNEDGLPNIANTAATRPRTALQGYDADGDGVFDSGWVIVAAEESKGLGRYAFYPNGEACVEDRLDPDCTADIGKNQWYYSFDMGKPNTSVINTKLEEDALVKNLVSQGNLLNQPEIDWRTGEFYPVINTSEMWDFGDYNFDLYNTEIARRSSMLSQGIKKIAESSSKLAAMPSWKQGTMRQGGPADAMYRRIVAQATEGGEVCTTEEVCTKCEDVVTCTPNAANPKYNPSIPIQACRIAKPPIGCYPYLDQDGNPTFEPQTCVVTGEDCNTVPSCEAGDPQCTCEDVETCVPGEDTIDPTVNPYAFRNMECANWLVAAGVNPYYPGGVCGEPANNLSAVVPDTCKDDDTGETIDCPTVTFDGTTFGIGSLNPILQGYIQGEGDTTRVLTWHQCPSDSTVVAGDIDPVTCATDTKRTDEFVNLKDQSWYNPLDVAKGHRGFMDGDFVMYLYAWSPNWRLNAKGNDRYDLYVRRSFDGGVTWQTTPTSFKASNGTTYALGEGTVTCETYRSTETQVPNAAEPHVCYEFAAGVNEHARNVTQHKRLRITTLDPRFAPSGGPRGSSILSTCIDSLGLPDTVDAVNWTCSPDATVADDDLRDPSRFAMVFETGDNNTVVDGEAEPLDLFYSRGERFGDHYVVWAETDTDTADLSLCYPSNAHEDPDIVGTVIEGSGFCNEFDRLNTGSETHSSEADLEMNPGGSKLYGVWTQWVFEGDRDNYEGAIIKSSAQARRVWWIDDDEIPDEYKWTLPGTNQPDDAEPVNP